MEQNNLIPLNSKCKRFYKKIFYFLIHAIYLFLFHDSLRHNNIFLIYKLTSPRLLNIVLGDQLIFTNLQ